ncbi:hypothetical protein FNF28_07800 [Cafeteria roenbergensis]|uniref:Uncharacterized protein n=1 Tax=Cafeteria roenbergensis TaxID=33653 RepID=A0A5A8C135_CAFRO|nr:hypothetical protein FNF28_07800 [Cafeteria roenbergensis]
MPSLSWIFVFTASMVSEDSTSSVMVLPAQHRCSVGTPSGCVVGQRAAVLELLAREDRPAVGRDASLSWIFVFTASMVSEDSTSSVMSCRRSTRCSVDSFWML